MVVISQPAADLEAPEDYAFEGAWLDQEIVISAGLADEYEHAILRAPEDSTALLSNAVPAVARFTPDVLGTYVYRLRWRLGYARGAIELVIRVERSSDGVEGYIIAPAYRETPAQAPGIAGTYSRLIERMARRVNESAAAVAGSVEAIPDTLPRRGDEGELRMLQTETQAIYAPDAATSEATPGLLELRAGRCTTNRIGSYPWSNMIWDFGFAAQSTSGEASGINLRYGDDRHGLPEGRWIAAEITFMGQFGFDPSPNGVQSTLPGALPPEATPYYLRIHTTTNARSGKGTGIGISAGTFLGLEARGGDIAETLVARGTKRLLTFPSLAPTTPTAGDGSGGSIEDWPAGCVRTSGAETKKCFVNKIAPSSHWAYVECRAIYDAPGVNVQFFRFRFWVFGTDSPNPPSHYVLEDLKAASDTPIAGRISVAADGPNGKTAISVTGVGGQNALWTVFVTTYSQPLAFP